MRRNKIAQINYIDIPSSTEPTLISGWQFLPTDWLFYWVGKHNPINNKFDNPFDRKELTESVNSIIQCRDNEISASFFRKLLLLKPTGTDITEDVIQQIGYEEGLISFSPETDFSARSNAVALDDEVQLFTNTYTKNLLKWLRGQIITISMTKFVGNGRHRIYDSFRYEIKELLVWVN